MIGRLTASPGICALAAVLLSSASFAESSSRSLLGNWAGTLNGDAIELAVWFDRKATELPIVRGYLVNSSRQCGIGVAGERTMSQVTTFFGQLADPDLTNYTLEFELRNLPAASFELCAVIPGQARLMLDYRPGDADARILGLDNPPQQNRMTRTKTLLEVERQVASSFMQSVITSNPAIDREQGPGAPPGDGVSRLLADGRLNPEQVIGEDELPCTVRQRDIQVMMRQRGIPAVTASLASPTELNVRFMQFPGPIPNGIWTEEFSASGNERTARVATAKITQAALLDMPAGKPRRFGPDACGQAEAVADFLAVLETSDPTAAAQVAASTESPPRLDDVQGLYFFDRDGIDQIDRSRMTRVLGTLTNFVPGDLSREGEWNAASQSMRMRAMVKTSQIDLIEEDLLSRYNVAHFVYDRELSKDYGDDVWTTVPQARSDNVCVRWRARHFVNNCVERATAKDYKDHRYYITRSLGVAKRLFVEISPDASLLSADELTDPLRGCSEPGPFCELPGGRYLNAIYNGDKELIREIDTEFQITLRATRPQGPLVADVDIIGAMFEIGSMPKSFGADLAQRYMHRYQELPRACLDIGHETIVKTDFIPAQYMPQPDINNIPQPDMKISEAQHLRTSYIVNPPFVDLCNRLCEALSDNPYAGETAATTNPFDHVTQSLDRVLFDHDCRSPEIKQFEENLIDIAIWSLSAGPVERFVQRSSL